MDLYVAIAEEDSISVISTSDMHEIRKIYAPGGPRRLIYHRNKLYCTASEASCVLCIDIGNGKKTFIPVGSYPIGICAIKDHLYVSCGESNSIWRIDTRKRRPAICNATGAFPICICVADNKVLCACMLCGNVSIFDIDLESRKDVPITGIPLCLDSGVCDVMVGSLLGNGKGLISVISPLGNMKQCMETEFPSATIKTLRCGNMAVIAHVWHDRISMVDLDSGETCWTVPSSRMPDDIAIDESEGSFYVSCMLDNCVEKYTLNGELLQRRSTGKEPRGLALV